MQDTQQSSLGKDLLLERAQFVVPSNLRLNVTFSLGKLKSSSDVGERTAKISIRKRETQEIKN
jgi:hypothetical protein